MQRGDIRFWMGMGGNLVAAISDSRLAEQAFRGTEMTVQCPRSSTARTPSSGRKP